MAFQPPLDDEGHGLEKSVWTDADFERMSWHDCQLYAVALIQDEVDEYGQSLLIDVDYIVKWAGGKRPGDSYTSWISPATLIFHEVYDLKGDLEGAGYQINGFYMDAIRRRPAPDPSGSDRWHIEAQLGLSFRSSGFTQILRRAPIHVRQQSLALDERGGLSFAQDAFDGAPTARSITHPANGRIARLLGATPRPDGEPREPLFADELRTLDWELAHLRLWLLAYDDIRRAEFQGERRRHADTLDDEYLALPEFEALRRIGLDPIGTRDSMVEQLRREADGEVARYASQQYGRALADIELLVAERSRLIDG